MESSRRFQDIQTFVQTYQGPKLRFLLTGAGSYLTGIIGVAGASKVVDSIYVPYSHEAVVSLLKRHPPFGPEILEAHGSVSPEMAVALHACNSSELSADVIPVTVTAAITTSRYRRGENRAFIASGTHYVRVWKLQLDKLDEHEHVDDGVIAQKRYVQDRIVSTTALCLATGLTNELVTELQEGGHLVELQ